MRGHGYGGMEQGQMRGVSNTGEEAGSIEKEVEVVTEAREIEVRQK